MTTAPSLQTMADEWRRYSRHEVARPYLVDVLGPDGRVLGVAAPREVSAGGVKLLSSRLYPVGSVLGLKGRQGVAGCEVAFRVTRAQTLPGFGAVLAGPFLTPIPDSVVLALVNG